MEYVFYNILTFKRGLLKIRPVNLKKKKKKSFIPIKHFMHFEARAEWCAHIQ